MWPSVQYRGQTCAPRWRGPLEPPALSAPARIAPADGGRDQAPPTPTHPHTLSCMQPRRRNLSCAALLWIYCPEEILHSKLYFYAALVGTLFCFTFAHAAAGKSALSLSNKSQWQLWGKNVSPDQPVSARSPEWKHHQFCSKVMWMEICSALHPWCP